MRQCFLRYPVRVIAVVLLPEHLHTLWTLPEGDHDYSWRWASIKREFTRGWLALGGTEQARSLHVADAAAAYGKGASGNIRFAMKRTWKPISTISITTR